MFHPGPRSGRLLAGLLLGCAALGACTPLRGHQGYVADADLVNAIQPGVDNRQSVLKTLGKPTFASQFNQGDWYYVSRDTRYLAYHKPKPVNETTIRIRFDDRGNVAGIDKEGLDRVASVDPYQKTTPTLGRKRSFFQSIFGNIGTVGAGAAGGGGAGGGDDSGQP